MKNSFFAVWCLLVCLYSLAESVNNGLDVWRQVFIAYCMIYLGLAVVLNVIWETGAFQDVNRRAGKS